MDISINTPALLFPAISLVMLAYTNRFLTLSARVRTLHDNYEKTEKKEIIHGQIRSIRYRIKLIKHMQTLGVLAFLCCILCMFFIYLGFMHLANWVFAFCMLSFALSLCFSLLEINLSMKAIELLLSDMEGLENPSVFEYFMKKFDNK